MHSFRTLENSSLHLLVPRTKKLRQSDEIALFELQSVLSIPKLVVNAGNWLCRKLCFFESKFSALTIKVLVRIVPPVVSFSDWRHFFSWEPVSADLNFRASEKDWVNAHARNGLTLSGSGSWRS